MDPLSDLRVFNPNGTRCETVCRNPAPWRNLAAFRIISYTMKRHDEGACGASHNPKVEGSNPSPATKQSTACSDAGRFVLPRPRPCSHSPSGLGQLNRPGFIDSRPQPPNRAGLFAFRGRATLGMPPVGNGNVAWWSCRTFSVSATSAPSSLSCRELSGAGGRAAPKARE